MASLFHAIFEEKGEDKKAIQDPYGLDPPSSSRYACLAIRQALRRWCSSLTSCENRKTESQASKRCSHQHTERCPHQSIRRCLSSPLFACTL